MITQLKADRVDDVVTGMVLLNSIPAFVLFDCGASHSFISGKFAIKLSKRPSWLDIPCRVGTMGDRAIESNWVYKNVGLRSKS